MSSPRPRQMRLDPRHTLFCHALISAVFDPRDAVISFGLRLIARHVASMGGRD